MNPKKKFYETAAETLIKNLDKRGMEAYYVDNGEEALKIGRKPRLSAGRFCRPPRR